MSRYLDLAHFGPGQRGAYDAARQQRRELDAYVNRELTQSRLKDLETMTESQMQLEAINRAEQQFGDTWKTMPLEEQRFIARKELDLYRGEMKGEQERLKELLNMAAQYSPGEPDAPEFSDDIIKAQVERRPWKDPKTGETRFGTPAMFDPGGAAGIAVRTLRGFGRGATGTLGGAAKYLREHGAAAELTQEPERTYKTPFPRTLEYLAKHGIEKPTEVPSTGAFSGVDPSKIPQAFLSGKASFGEMIGAALETGKKAMMHPDPESIHDWVAELFEVRRNYRKQAALQLVDHWESQGIDPASMEEKERYAQLDKFTQNLIAQDPMASNPDAVQFMSELVLDPFFLPIGKAVNLATRAAGRTIPAGVKTAVAAKVAEFNKKLDPLRWEKGVTKEFDRAGEAVGKISDSEIPTLPMEDIGAMMENELVLAGKQEEEIRKMGRHLRPMKPEGGDEMLDEVAMELVERGAMPEQIAKTDPSLASKIAASHAMEKEHRAARKLTGLGHDVTSKGKIVTRIHDVDQPHKYVPHRIRAKKDPVTGVVESADELQYGGGAVRQENLKVGSAKARRVEFAPGSGLHAQQRSEFAEIMKRGPAALRVRAVQRAAQKGKALISIPLPKVKLGAAKNFITQASRQLGIKEPQLRAILQGSDPATGRGVWEAAENFIKDAKVSARRKRQLQHSLNESKISWLQNLQGLAKAKRTIGELNATSGGVNFTALSTHQIGQKGKPLAEVWFRLRGKSLPEEVGHMIHIVPEPVARYVSSMLPMLYENPKKSIVEDVFKFMTREVLGPLNTVARTGMTVLSGGTGYITRNIVSIPGLNSLNLGIDAVNPQHYLRAGTQAFGVHGMKAGQKQLGKLADGTRRSNKWVIRQMENSGLFSQADIEMGFTADKMSKNPLKWIQTMFQRAAGLDAPGVPKVIKKLSPRAVNSIVENFHKASVFNAVLKGSSPADVARAARLTRKWTGDYRTLAPFEREIMQNATMFYGFYKFAYSQGIKTLFKNPQRLSWITKVQAYHEREMGKYFPQDHKAYPKHFEGLLWTASKELQHPDFIKAVEDGRYGDAAKMVRNVQLRETPLAAVLPILQMVGNVAEGGPGRIGRDGVARHLSIWLIAGISAIQGRDFMTGKDLEGVIPDLFNDKTWKQSRQDMMKTALGQAMVKSRKGYDTMQNMVQMFLREGHKPRPFIDMGMATAARNALSGGEILIGEFADSDAALPMSLPGSSIFPIDPYRNIGLHKRPGEELLKQGRGPLYR